MSINSPALFIEINSKYFVFVGGYYDDNNNLKILEKIKAKCEGVDKNRLTDLEQIITTIKKNVSIIENKLNCIFKETFVIIDNFDDTCISISGFKKLNESQIIKENISYILNSLKLTISNNEKDKTILHIFNSKSILDGKLVDNLPIGLYGDFYSHELTFFLIRNTDIKNINQIFKKVNLHVNKIFIKNYVEGSCLINKHRVKTFFLKLNKDNIKLIFFDKSSFRYSQFNFGTDIILKDISKVCSLGEEAVIKILTDNILKKKIFNEDEFLEEKYFIKDNFRKIRKKLIKEVAIARIEEIVDLVIKKNLNLKSFKKDNVNNYIFFEDENISNNFFTDIRNYISLNFQSNLKLINRIETEELVLDLKFGIIRLKEAILIIKQKLFNYKDFKFLFD